MTPKEFEEKMKANAYKLYYEEEIDQEQAEINAINLMVEALAENGFDRGIFYYKNFIEE